MLRSGVHRLARFSFTGGKRRNRENPLHPSLHCMPAPLGLPGVYRLVLRGFREGPGCSPDSPCRIVWFRIPFAGENCDVVSALSLD